ncbi:MAG: hypothetical protein WCL16_07525, partial [bacterium]
LLYAIVAPGWLVNGTGRMLAPWADIPAYAATRIVPGSVKPGDVRVPEGAQVELEAAVEGRTPETATWRWNADGQAGRSATVAASHDARNIFKHAQSNVIASFTYFLEAGDGRSRTYRVEVVPRPRVQRVTASVRLPDYTGGEVRMSRDPDGGAHAPAGSQVRIEICATKPLKAAWLQLEGGLSGALPLTRIVTNNADQAWQGAVWLWSAEAKKPAPAGAAAVTGEARYRIMLADNDGYETCDPVWRKLLPERDQRPAVAISQPGRDVQAYAGATIPVTIEVNDDFGVASATLLAKVHDAAQPQTVAVFRYPVPGASRVREVVALALPALAAKPGDLIHVWAVAEDHNTLTGPGRSETRAFTVVVTQSHEAEPGADLRLEQTLTALETILRLQQQNRGETAAGLAFAPLASRQITIRILSAKLARALEHGPLPLETVVQALDHLTAGPMAEAVRLCETGRDAVISAPGAAAREQALPVMDRIITALQELLARLQKDAEARRALRSLGKHDPLGKKAIVDVLTNMLSHLDRMSDETRAATNRFEKMPKRGTNETTDASADSLHALQVMQEKWADWTKGTIDDLAKLPSGFIDDFGLRADTKRLYEEIEAMTNRPKAVKMEIAWEDTAPGLATRMKEDLEVWMPDAPDNVRWVLEDPLKGTQPMEIPEMPLPDKLEDMIGDLLQKADEFDQASEDASSMIGDNLDQAGWGVSDGPISSFSAKGKTGNDLPNANEINGRSGDGRRGQSSGQMVGDTARGLDGRKTPARLTSEKYEPGALKQTGRQDPNGATGGGKKAGAGARGLQGGTPPDYVKMQERLDSQLKGLREKAEQVARDLEKLGVVNRRLNASIGSLRALEQGGRDHRYSDAARRRHVALDSMTGALVEIDQSTAVQWSRAVRLPEPLRDEISQAASERFPEGYEESVKRYFRTLSDSEGQE